MPFKKPSPTRPSERGDDLVPFTDSEELARMSRSKLIDVGTDHWLADHEPMEMMLGE
jgi:hypothetical protein